MDVQAPIPPPPPPPPPSFFTETTVLQQAAPPPPPPPPAPAPVTTAAPPSQDRIWLHPWTVTEMRENASKWSLASDAGLLLYLEQFSEKLTQQAESIQQHLNQTVNAVKSTHTRVQNCLNEFTSLANTQFIENRVYEEDETASVASSKKDEQSAEKTSSSTADAQEKVLQRYVEAAQYGLAVLDTHFERVDAKLVNNASGNPMLDDDDEDGGMPIEPILEPKDPYVFRSLPYLIGTPEFMQDEYVGLGDLLTVDDTDENHYGFERIENKPEVNGESDSLLTSSDDENGFEAQVTTTTAIVPAGASQPLTRPDVASRPTAVPAAIFDDDNDDEDDDLFRPTTTTNFNHFSNEKRSGSDELFPNATEPSKLTTIFDTHKQDVFAQGESDDEEKDIFGIVTNKPPKTQLVPPPAIVAGNSEGRGTPIVTDDDELSASLSEEPITERKFTGAVSMLGPQQKGVSELEKAVLRRRKMMGDDEAPPDNEEDDDDIKPSRTVKVPKVPANDTRSALLTQPTAPKAASSQAASSSTISVLASQPLTAPSTSNTLEKIVKPSLFDKEEEDEDDLFRDTSTPSATLLSSSNVALNKKSAVAVTSPVKVKDLFDEDTDDEDSPFTIKKKNIQSNVIAKKPDKKEDRTIKHEPISIPKSKPIDDNDSDDDLFATTTTRTKKLPTLSATAVAEKSKSPSSDEDLFKSGTVIKPQAPPPTIVAKSLDEDEALFGIKPQVQQSAPPPPVAMPSIKKPATTVDDDSDEDALFGIKKSKPAAPATVEIKKVVQPEEEKDDLFLPPKPQVVLTPPLVLPPLPSAPSSKTTNDDDDDDDIFGISKKTTVTVPPPAVVKPVNSPPALATEVPKKSVESPVGKNRLESNDEDDDIFGVGVNKKTTAAVPPPAVVEPVKPPPGAVVPKKPVESPVVKKRLDSDSDEELFGRKPQNVAALKDGEKPNVKALSSLLKINPTAHRPGAARPKAASIVVDKDEESPSATFSSPLEDEKPAVAVLPVPTNRAPEPVPTVTKKSPISKRDSDSEEELFGQKKTPITKAESPAAAAIVEKKDDKPDVKPSSENDSAKVNVKALSSLLKINPTTHIPGARPKSISVEEGETLPTERRTSSIIPEEPTADKTMLNILKDRAKVSVKTRTPPSRKPRSTAAAAAAAANDNDDLFALPSSSPPTPAPAPVPIQKAPPPQPVAGLPAAPAHTATPKSIFDDDDNDHNNNNEKKTASLLIATKEKKKFSLFDSDDSDTDELLFGVSTKNKPTPVSKPTAAPSPASTSKTVTKPSLLSLDDDDDDFLSKRSKKPTTTKTAQSTKPSTDDDIFADVEITPKKANKAKKDWKIMDSSTNDTDDISASKPTGTTKSSATSKSKASKDLGDIFQDPLDVLSKIDKK